MGYTLAPEDEHLSLHSPPRATIFTSKYELRDEHRVRFQNTDPVPTVGMYFKFNRQLFCMKRHPFAACRHQTGCLNCRVTRLGKFTYAM
jgi:hypothetical protein